MKIVYLINSKQYSYHRDLIRDFTDVIPGDVIDVSDDNDPGISYRKVTDSGADVIITFDLAGHIMRTGSDTLSLNNIYARMAHILFHKTDYYGQDIRARQNLSMFMYIVNGEDIDACREKYGDVPNILSFAEIDRKADNEAQHEKNRNSIITWWDEFKKENKL